MFGGLQKNSFIDFPGKVSCVLFVRGCNFRCPYCHNPQLLSMEQDSAVGISRDQVMGFLQQRKGLLDAVVISGGEPTLREDLKSLCREIKSLGYTVKLDTNGSRPEVIRHLMDAGLIDYIAMDIKTAPDRYAPLIRAGGGPQAVLSSIRLILESAIPHEFRTTCLWPLVDASIMEEIARLIEGAELLALQQFRNGDVLDPAFCRQHEAHTDAGTMTRLESIAAPWVQSVIVR